MPYRWQARLRWPALPAIPAIKDNIRTSLWVVPVVYMFGAGVLALSLLELDHRLSPKLTSWFMYRGQADGARELLSTIASSMLSIATLVFSITILVLQLASSQFSPRVLRSFLKDRVTQRSLGMFLAAFVYALMLLPRVLSETEHSQAFVPGLAVFTGFGLALLSVAFFVRYIHHMAHSIRAVNIISSVAHETRDSIERLYPERFLESAPPSLGLPGARPDLVLVNTGEGGVLISVDEEALLHRAFSEDLIFELVPCVGDFVPNGAPLARVWGTPAAQLAATDFVVLAIERTPHQDAAYGFRQLVDIAERALSPGLNDPTTAVQALDQLHDLLRGLSRRSIPAAARVDEDGRLRLWLPRPGWQEYVALAFEEIRAYGSGSIQVLRRGRNALLDLMAIAPEPRLPPLRQQLTLFERALERYEGGGGGG